MAERWRSGRLSQILRTETHIPVTLDTDFRSPSASRTQMDS